MKKYNKMMLMQLKHNRLVFNNTLL